MAAPIDWTGCSTFNIGSGSPTFEVWDHLSDNSIIDELKFYNRALTPEEVAGMFGGGGGSYETFGSTLYLPFDGNYTDVSQDLEPTVVGSPGFAGESAAGSDAYAGTADSYL